MLGQYSLTKLTGGMSIGTKGIFVQKKVKNDNAAAHLVFIGGFAIKC